MPADAPDPKSQARPFGVLLGRSPSGFSNAVTLGLALLLAGALFLLSLVGSAVERPVDTAMRTFERDLEIEDGLQVLPPWARTLVALAVDAGAETKEEAIAAFEALIARGGLLPLEVPGSREPTTPEMLDSLRARRAVLLFDVGRREGARGDLDKLLAAGHSSFVAALRVAFATTRNEEVRPFSEYDVAVAGDGWIGRRLQHRLALATRDAPAQARIEGELRARSDVVSREILRIGLAYLIPLALGLLALLVWLARNRPDGERAEATIPPAWTFENGFAVLVRAVAPVFVVEVVLLVIDASFGQRVFSLWRSLFAALPVFWLLRRRLLARDGPGFAQAFGLASVARPVSWIAFTLGVFAIDQLGSQALTTGLRIAGITSHWSEHVLETTMWSSRPLALLDAVDGCVWAPFLEEFICRGILYLTLRRQYPPWRAALLSGAIFGAMHVYSLPGLVSVTWSGFVWAMAFERCRSLWPGIVCHALNNAIVIASAWVFYR